VALTPNEHKTTERLKTDSWLCVVINCDSETEAHVIQDLVRLGWETLLRIEHYHVGPEQVLRAGGRR
jgi:hypothetical protein